MAALKKVLLVSSLVVLATANPIENEELFEGDIRLTKEQIMELRERKMTTESRHFWTSPIEYILTDQVDDRKDAIRLGVKDWESKTCLRFTELESTDDASSSQPHLSFISAGGCWSYLGKVWPGGHGQSVSIAPGCTRMGTVAHEIGHAMGFFHEQSRTDRDENIRVNWDNIKSYGKSQYETGGDTHGVPYDYGSTMHYAKWMFATSYNVHSFDTLDPIGNAYVGQRTHGLSHMDAYLANMMYGCIDASVATCGEKANPCRNWGYILDDCSCRCPPGTSGDLCETIDRPYRVAQHDMFVPRSTTVVTEPREIKSSSTTDYEILKWEVVAPKCEKLKIDFSKFELDTSTDCLEQYVMITTGGKVNKYCGTDLAGKTLYSTGQAANIVWASYGSATTGGWSASVSFEEDPDCDKPEKC